MNVAFFIMAGLAAAGLVVDVWALVRRVARQFAIAALALKGVVVFALAAWAVYFRLLGLTAGDWADLALIVVIMLVGTPLLAISVVCDAMVVATWSKSRASS